MRGSYLRWLAFLIVLATLAAGLLSLGSTTSAADVADLPDRPLTVTLQSVGACPTGWWVGLYNQTPYYFYIQDGYTQFKDVSATGPDLDCSVFTAPMRVEIRVPRGAGDLPPTPTAAPGAATPANAYKAHVVIRLAAAATATPVSTEREFVGQLATAWTTSGLVTFSTPTGSFQVRVSACTTQTSNCTRVDGPTPTGTGALANVHTHSTSNGEWFADSVEFLPPISDQTTFSGLIQRLPSAPFTGTWTIGGRSVLVDNQTILPNDRALIAVNNFATVQGEIRSDQVYAHKIDITALTAPEANMTTVQGVVTNIDEKTWSLDCVAVNVPDSVTVTPAVQNGDVVTIVVAPRSDSDVLQARSVTTNAPGSFPSELSVILKGSVDRRTGARRVVIAGQSIESTAAVPPMILPGSIVEARAKCVSNSLKGTITLTSQATRFTDVIGVIQDIRPSPSADGSVLWTLLLPESSTTVDVRVTKQTFFDPSIPRSWATVGARVSVSGVPSADGTRIDVDRVQILEPAHATRTPTSTSPPSPTATSTLTPTPMPTETPTATLSPSETPTATLAPTDAPVPTDTPTDTPIVTATDTPTDTPTGTPTPTDIPTDTPTAMATDSPTMTPTDTPLPTDTPTLTLTDTPTATPTDTPPAALKAIIPSVQPR
ncbi:MAG: DUF5666 domain-containing protein [Anaerolineae bacterium]